MLCVIFENRNPPSFDPNVDPNVRHFHTEARGEMLRLGQ